MSDAREIIEGLISERDLEHVATAGPIWTALDTADAILAALEAEGYRVERLESVGWQVKMPFKPTPELVQRTGSLAFEWRRSVFAVIPDPLPVEEKPQ